MDQYQKPSLITILLILVLLIIVFYITGIQNNLTLLDNANLLFHEAGHMVFGLVGIEFITVLGGTLLQLIIPMIIIFYFYSNSNSFGAQVGLYWLGENIVNIARYVGDANVKIIPLIGGGHDWEYLLSQMGILSSAETLGGFLRIIGIMIMLAIIIRMGYQILWEINNRKKSISNL